MRREAWSKARLGPDNMKIGSRSSTGRHSRVEAGIVGIDNSGA